jgi:hypothetical protein
MKTAYERTNKTDVFDTGQVGAVWRRKQCRYLAGRSWG